MSTSFCLPVKKGWHSLQSSTRRVDLVDSVVKVLPHEQVTVRFAVGGVDICFHDRSLSAKRECSGKLASGRRAPADLGQELVVGLGGLEFVDQELESGRVTTFSG